MIPTYQEFLTEGRITFNKMSFTVSAFNDTRGLCLQFIPDSKTLDGFPTTEQVAAITERLKKGMPQFASLLYFETDNQAAGLVFRVNPYELTEVITKAMK
jgi:hypothetical protein